MIDRKFIIIIIKYYYFNKTRVIIGEKMIFGRHVNKYYFKYAHLFLIGVAVLLVLDYAQLKIPEIYRMLLTGINTGFIDAQATVPLTMDVVLDKICLPMLVIIALMLVGRFTWRICFFSAGTAVEEDLKRRMFDRTRVLSQDYYAVNKVGNLMSLFTNDVSVINEAFGWGILMVCDVLFLGVLAAINMVKVQPLLAVLCLIPMALLLAAAVILNKYLTKKWTVREEAFSAISDHAQESFSGLYVVKAFVREAWELMKFKKLNRKNEDANVDYTKLSVAMRVIVMLFVESIIGVIIGAGGYLVYIKEIRAEYLIEFIGYFTAIIWPVMAVSELIDMYSRGKASYARIAALLDAKPTVCDGEGAVDISDVKGEIEFKNLTFSYPDDPSRIILNDVSFTVSAGENIGIIGRIGSGKSTVAELLTRIYNVPKGTLFIDGKDVNDLTLKSVRDNVSCVFQENFVFSDTVAANIALSRKDAPRELIESVAKTALVHEDVKAFQSGFDTVLGERGTTVSGGQKQRICLARALLKNAPVLVLDDCLSAVDSDTEKKISDNLIRERAGKTTIMIAHRISTVSRLDRILFLESGKVVAFDTHENLMKTCKPYARLAELQSLEDREVVA